MHRFIPPQLLVLALALPAAAIAATPIAQRFNADPSPHYFKTAQGGKFYLYATDDASNSGKYWDSTSWRLYTSTDMQRWQDAGIPLAVTVFKWARPDAKAWAPEAAYRNGKYYFYAPVGGDKIGVAVSDRPDGGFIDARSDALVDKARDANAGDEPIDPAVFIDQDGQAYMYFGTRVPKVVKLKADMATLDGPIRNVEVQGYPAADPHKKYGEAPFLHRRGGVYYFSFSTGWPGQIVYATGASPLGPFTYRGVVLDYLKISTNHQAILAHEGKDYLFYHDSLLPGGGDHRRSIAIAPLDYAADGSIRQVKLQPSQVGKPPRAEAPLRMPEMHLHDPFIVADQASKTYHLYTSNVPGMSGDCGVGIMAYTSRDLLNWTKPKVVFKLPAGSWAKDGAWAPEVHRWRGKYYLFTTLHNEQAAIAQPSASGWKPYRRGTVMAVADRPEGPFVLANGGEPVAPADQMTLDGTLHVDKQGKPWYVYAHEWIQTADGAIAAIPLTDELKPAGPATVLFRASQAAWARGQSPTAPDGTPAKARVYVTDGPQLYYSKDGSLLMLWSSYDANGYVQSVARSASGDIKGPWTQLDPIVARDSGHGMLFDSFDGKRMLVLHRPFKNARGKLYEVRDGGGKIQVLNQRVDLDGDATMGPSPQAPRLACPAP